MPRVNMAMLNASILYIFWEMAQVIVNYGLTAISRKSQTRGGPGLRPISRKSQTRGGPGLRPDCVRQGVAPDCVRRIQDFAREAAG